MSLVAKTDPKYGLHAFARRLQDLAYVVHSLDGHLGVAGAVAEDKVARWQNLIPSFPWIAPGWRAWGLSLMVARWR